MSKYIIELKDDVQVVQKVGVAKNGNAFVMTFYKDQLEELTANYINEHYGDLMDEEIRQALSEVREMKQMCGNINMKLTNIVTQRGQDWKKKLEAEYQRGFKDGKAVSDKGCAGCEYAGKIVTGPPCITCSNSYKNQWTAKQTDNEIKVGDEVETEGGKKYVVVSFGKYKGEEVTACGFNADGYWCGMEINTLRKTGNHFDIASILKEMQTQ